jgi:pyruvate dehydrogenase E2 component (dihydrolipoamide acetyltransferase)
MAEQVTLPKLSDTMEEGTILKWFKEEGDYVQKGETLFEVETDKAVMEVEAFSSGVLSSILVQAGEKVPVGTPIAIIGDEEEKSTDEQSSSPKEEETEDEKPAEPDEEKGVDKKPSKSEEEETEDEQLPEPKGKGAEDEEPVEPQEKEPVSEKPAEAKEKGAKNEQSPEPKKKKAEDEESAELKEKGIADKKKATVKTKTQKSKPKAEKKKQPSKKEKDQEGTAPKERVNASPAAKSFAQQRAIDLAQITGTGKGGMITLSDVRNNKESVKEKEPSPPSLKTEMLPEEEITELSNMRKAIASTVSYSKHHIPHFYVTYEIDMSGVVAQLEQSTQSDDEKITVNDIIVRAVAAILKDYPYLNAIYPEQGLIVKKKINIGVVMGLPDGLVIPVLKNCDKLTLEEISIGIRALREKAETGKFSSADFTDGTFSVSNLGMLGVTDFAAIIYPPQTGILAVSAIQDTPVSKEGNIVTAALMKVTLSVDHRVVDGVTAANFLRDLKKYLETEKLTAMEKPCCTVDEDGV